MYKLCYIASPYKHDDPEVVKERVLLVTKATAVLVSRGFFVYSPIVHNHQLHLIQDLPHGWVFWRGFDFCMLSRCDELLILPLPGWEKSVGMKEEFLFATKYKIPVRMLDPNNFRILPGDVNFP